MQVVLYVNKSDKRKLEKELIEVANIDCKIKDDCSILNPTLIIKIDSVDYNYVYIPEFNRYYYIDDIVTLNSRLKEISCSVDVRQSYREQLRDTSAIIARNERYYNQYIPDNMIGADSRIEVTAKKFPYSLGVQSLYLYTM